MKRSIVIDHTLLWRYEKAGRGRTTDLANYERGSMVIGGIEFTLFDLTRLEELATAKNLTIAVVLPSLSAEKEVPFKIATYLSFAGRHRIIAFLGGPLYREDGTVASPSEFPWYQKEYIDLKYPIVVGPARKFPSWESVPSFAALEEALAKNIPNHQRHVRPVTFILPPQVRVSLHRFTDEEFTEKFIKTLTWDLDVGIFDVTDLGVCILPLPKTEGGLEQRRIIVFVGTKAVEFISTSEGEVDVSQPGLVTLTFLRPTQTNLTGFFAFMQLTNSNPKNFRLAAETLPEVMPSALTTGIRLADA